VPRTAKGVRREVSFGIDSLRNAAKRGTGCVLGVAVRVFGFRISSPVHRSRRERVLSAVRVCVRSGVGRCSLRLVFGWFCAWAALYTNLDLNTDDS
jgi:hypothetical protein